MQRTGERATDALRRLDFGIVVLAAALLLISFAIYAEPDLSPVLVARELDLAIDVAATLVGAAVALLAWVRWQETRAPSALYESAAFGVLTLTNALFVGLIITGQGRLIGLDPLAPGDAATYVWAEARLMAAFLLVIGGIHGLRSTRLRLPALLVAIGPAAIMLVFAVIVAAVGACLPAVVPLEELVRGVAVRRVTFETAAGAMAILLQVFTCSAFIVAALLYRRLFRRERAVSQAFLVVGLVVAAFSQLHFALTPVSTYGVVTTSDILRLAFFAILFLGIEAEAQSDLQALRTANVELRRLRDVDAANAGLAERARLAREIHDGLAQDLWYAKLKQSRLAAADELSDETRKTVQEVLNSLDSALSEARQAVMAMRADPATASLEDVLRTYLDDFADRFGIRAEFSIEGSLPRLSPRTEAELLRIVQEALNNIRKHADATVVRVRVERTDGRVLLTIADNGRGFDPSTVGGDRFGLQSMRERAELVGAELDITSTPSDGTRVQLDMPLASPS